MKKALLGTAAVILGGGIFTVVSSIVFLAGTKMFWLFPRPFYQWWMYLAHLHENPIVDRWLGIGGAAGMLAAAGVGAAMLFRSGLSVPSLRPRSDGEPHPVIRGGSDNHGHADWMTMKEACRTFVPSSGGEPYLVVGEAYRVDQDKVAKVAFDPRNRATWGKGGKTPLLVDPCTDGPTHSLMFAGSGGLKTSCAITRLMWWRGSAIVLDPSREMGPMVRKAREDMGQTVIELGPDGVGMNVLGGIDPRSPQAARRLLSAVASLCGEEPDRGDNSIFSDAGRNLITCILSHIVWDETLPRQHRTLAFFRELITTPEADMKRLLAGIAATTKSTTARLIAATLMGLADDTFSGAYFNATQFTAWLFDDAVVDMLSGGSFTAADVVRGPVTVFVQVPLDVLMTTPAVGRMVLDALAWAFIEADGAYHSRTLMLVDEASKLGRMKSIEIVRDTGRKYGLTLHMLYLSEAELAEVWGPRGVARWFATVSWRGYAGVSDRETAKGLSEDIGDMAVMAVSEGKNKGTSGRAGGSSTSRGSNASTHEIKRRLILPSELTEARADELFVIRKGSPPLRCAQAPYFRRADLVPLVGSNRFVRTPTAAE